MLTRRHLKWVFSLSSLVLISACDSGSNSKTTTPTTPNPAPTPAPVSLLQEMKSANEGYKIAYSDTVNIYMMDPDGSNVVLLADGAPVSGYPSWGPHSQYVYFASAKGESNSAWEAFRVNVSSKEVSKISNFGKDVRAIAVSPDNRYLALSIMSGNSNINNNNDNLTQFNTDLYIMDMSEAESMIASNVLITMDKLTPLVSSPAEDKFWYEELNWNPVLDGGEPILAYTKTWRYDEDDVSYTHAYTIRADGSEQKLIAENKDQPIWDFTGKKLSFLDFSYHDFDANELKTLKVTGIQRETSAPAISPDGNFIIFEIGDENRKAGVAKFSSNATNPGKTIPDVTVYEPRWSTKPVIN